jgi:glycerophosphoryl diester phosphodiesterase
MKIIGHRGARGLAPENTIAGLQKGLVHNVDMIEFDLHVTKDGVPVLHHWGYLADPDGRRLKIKQHDYQELLSHKSDLASLEDVFTKVSRSAIFYIEVKRGVDIGPIVAVIKRHIKKGWPADHLFLSSKSQRVLMDLHRALPEVQKIVIEMWSGISATHRARQVNTKKLSMNKMWLWFGFIGAVSKRGYELYAYTLNDPAKAKRWERYGLAGVVTDYPDRFET